MNIPELARSADNLVGLMAKLDEKRCIKQKDEFFFHREDAFMSLRIEDLFDGLGHSDVIFWHYFQDDQERFKTNLGIDTPNRLTLGILTDIEDVEQLKAYLTVSIKDLGIWESIPDEKKSEYEDVTFPAIGLNDDIETDFFVDIDGNNAKVLGLPTEIEDPREQVVIEGFEVNDMQFVRAKITPRDFVLMKSVLSTMTLRVQDSLRKSGLV